MKRKNVTFSIKENINLMLHAYVEKRGLSRFVNDALEDALEKRKKDLKAAYLEAENDPDSKEIIDDWAALDGENWDE